MSSFAEKRASFSGGSVDRRPSMGTPVKGPPDRDGRPESMHLSEKLEAMGQIKIAGAGGAAHSFSEEEKIAFSAHINESLGRDPIVARHLPLGTFPYVSTIFV